MAESNATQVILTDDGIKIIKAQNTADNATSQAGNADSAALIAQSMANAAKVAADSNYNYANSEIAVQSTATAKAQSTADNAFSQAQAVGSQASAEIQNNSTATAKAQSAAANAFSQAQAVGSQASAEIQNNSTATAKAQSTADNAFSQATTAIDNGNVTSQAVTDLKDGSTMTIAELQNGLATKVANSEYASYKTQTASQIAQKVDNGAFSAYKTQTADLIASKVATKDFSAYKAITAKSIESKVESKDFNTYKTQTADLIDDKVSSSEYASDKTQTASEIADRVSNSAFSTYQDQTASQISQKVDNGAFSTYKTQTADLIESKVDNDTYQTDKTQTAKEISSKVESSDFNTYKTQTANLIDDKVSSSEYASDKTQTASEIADRVSNSAFSTYQTQTASQIAQKVDNGAFSAYQSTTADLIASKVATKDFSAYRATTAKSIESKVESSDFNTYKTQTADMIASKVSTVDFNNLTISNRNLALGTATPFTMTGNNTTNNVKYLYPTSGTIAKGTTITVTFDITSTDSTGNYSIQFKGGTWQSVAWGLPLVSGTRHYSYTFKTTADFSGGLNLRLDNATATVTVSNFIISESSKEVSWTPAPEDQATQSQITQLSHDINLRVTKGDLIDQINIQAGNTLISSSGQLTLAADTIYFDTKKPVIIPSANITGTLTGKTINGSTINATTFNGGSRINNPNNTAGYYPMTITPDGAYKSTYFDNAVGLQSSVESGAISYKYRSMIGSNGQYLAYDSVINGQGFESHSGYTSVKDATFSNTETITGYVNVTPSTGIYLYGPTQKINFAGNSDNIGSDGITMDAYGNLYGQNNSAYWRIGDSDRKRVADFGLDKKSGHQIIFSRNTSIGNLFLGVGHTIGMLDKKPLYFKRGDSRGNMLDIKAGAVHYTSLVKSSLLSVKKDVQKADTAYWAQLVNSIDLATYQYKSDDNTSHIRLSSIVDDVNDTKQWQLPDVFISRDEDGKLSGVDDSVLLNATLATVQEQQKQIGQLNGHNMELEARLNKLEAKLNGQHFNYKL
ncbi:gp58-like family protein [Lactiplantibacillus pentosus]|uniref:gp58-like family protein n=1 Tax=Lactiplantibacillus pentosus TaxID=1589 RepID=UPI001C1F66C3|nr:gp58-like family protein [Lactiplantibacillus pentosus]MBU7481969.1 phage tail protein [Lactiplantibacillus pentosus]